MRRTLLATAIGAIVVAALLAQQAVAQAAPDHARHNAGNVHPHQHAAGHALQGAGHAVQGPGRFAPRGRSAVVVPVVVPRVYYGGYPGYYGAYQPYYGGYGYYPYYSAPYPYYAAPYPYYGGYLYPPVSIPASTLFGPSATRRFMTGQ
jgi:hypothetical protein